MWRKRRLEERLRGSLALNLFEREGSVWVGWSLGKVARKETVGNLMIGWGDLRVMERVGIVVRLRMRLVVRMGRLRKTIQSGQSSLLLQMLLRLLEQTVRVPVGRKEGHVVGARLERRRRLGGVVLVVAVQVWVGSGRARGHRHPFRGEGNILVVGGVRGSSLRRCRRRRLFEDGERKAPDPARLREWKICLRFRRLLGLSLLLLLLLVNLSSEELVDLWRWDVWGGGWGWGHVVRSLSLEGLVVERRLRLMESLRLGLWPMLLLGRLLSRGLHELGEEGRLVHRGLLAHASLQSFEDIRLGVGMGMRMGMGVGVRR